MNLEKAGQFIWLNARLEELAASQQEDGGWGIRWQPPGEMAVCEWRAIKTLHALAVLRAYGKL